MNLEEFRALASRLDRTQFWGPSDELGAMNFVTPATVLRAVAGVTHGEVISCTGRRGGDMLEIRTSTDQAETWTAINESVAFAQHGASSMTHMDALAHFTFDSYGHAGYGARDLTPSGVTSQDISTASGGVVARGILLDLPRLRGAPCLGPKDRVSQHEARNWLDEHEDELGSGDVLFVRTGRPASSAVNDAGYPDVGGLDVDCLEWIHDRECAVVVSDAGMDTTVSSVDGVAVPWHVMTIARMGVRLVDHADLDALAAACQRYGRLHFLSVLAPLHLPGATASPINPLAVF